MIEAKLPPGYYFVGDLDHATSMSVGQADRLRDGVYYVPSDNGTADGTRARVVVCATKSSRATYYASSVGHNFPITTGNVCIVPMTLCDKLKGRAADSIRHLGVFINSERGMFVRCIEGTIDIWFDGTNYIRVKACQHDDDPYPLMSKDELIAECRRLRQQVSKLQKESGEDQMDEF